MEVIIKRFSDYGFSWIAIKVWKDRWLVFTWEIWKHEPKNWNEYTNRRTYYGKDPR